VTVASRTLSKAEELCSFERPADAGPTTAVQLDVSSADDLTRLEELVRDHNACISMLPYVHHPLLAEMALRHGKHFLTTSYVSDAMSALADRARERGVLLMNECGLDPGTDHMSAKRVIDQAHADGGKVVSFLSYCGGLPAPVDNNNPFGYKFSWAPRGVLLAGLNTARFYRDGEAIEVGGGTLFDHYSHDTVDHPIVEGLTFECYPNRDSTPYREIFNIPECKTLIRGTYRYAGWCRTVKKLTDLGLVDQTARVFDGKSTYAQLVLEGVGEHAKEATVREAVAKFCGLESDDDILNRMEWLGLFGDTPVDASITCNLDATCKLMMDRKEMQLGEGEQDMVVMKHTFVIEYADRRDTVTSTLVELGVKNGDTAMSRTVSTPVAIATRMLLEGKYTEVGLQRPIEKAIYAPILDELQQRGIMTFHEKVIKSEKL